MHATQTRLAPSYTYQSSAAPEYPDIRPLITRHKLRRQRRRKAATLLTGASIALGAAALRTPNASADSPKVTAPITHAHGHPTHEPESESRSTPVATHDPAPG